MKLLRTLASIGGLVKNFYSQCSNGAIVQKYHLRGDSGHLYARSRIFIGTYTVPIQQLKDASFVG